MAEVSRGCEVLSRTGQGRGEHVCQRPDAATAPLGMRTRGAPLQASRAGGRDVLGVTEGALLGLLCSAVRRAPCAWRASPAELTYVRLQAARLVGTPKRADCPK